MRSELRAHGPTAQTVFFLFVKYINDWLKIIKQMFESN